MFVCYKVEIQKHAFHVTGSRRQVEWELKSSSLCTFNLDRFEGPLGFFPSTVRPLGHVCILILKSHTLFTDLKRNTVKDECATPKTNR